MRTEDADPVRIGVIGMGSVFGDSYGRIMSLLEFRGLLRVVVGCDLDPEREHRAFRKWFPEARFTTDASEVIGADDVEAVVVLTTPQGHAPVAIAALEAGKHVMVEKPMAQTLEDAARIVELASASSLVLVCAPHVILSPTYQIIWKRLRLGEIGKVLLSRARYGEPPPGANIHALTDMGVYNITSLTGWLGPAKRVMAMSGIAIPEFESRGRTITKDVSDNTHVLIDFGESSFAVVSTGWSFHQYRGPAIELYGSEGVIQLMGADWNPDGYELWRPHTKAWQLYPEADLEWDWCDGVEHMVRCIRSGEASLITPEHAYHVTEIMLKAEESAAEGRAVEIKSSFSDLRFDIDAIDLYQQYNHDGISRPVPFKIT